MKRSLFLLTTLMAGISHASTPVVAPGGGLTLGPSSNHHSVFAASHNPAMASFVVPEGERWRMNYAPGLAFSYELGDAENFVDEIDDLIDILDDPSQSEDSVEETLARFNELLVVIGQEGYMAINARITAPLLPIYFRPSRFSGTFFAELDTATQIHLSVLDSELAYNNQTGSYTTATSAYVKSGIEHRLALGYSRELFEPNKFETMGGRLYGGLKLNIINLGLSKQVMRLEALDGRDIMDVVEDEYEANLVTTTNFGIDVGMVWDAERYRLGFTLANINAPKFDYGSVGENCDLHAEGSVRRNNCNAAFYFSREQGRIAALETHTKHPTATIDGTLFVTPRWLVSSAVDIASFNDLVGMENQWLHLSTSYYPKPRWVPDIRAGYQKNLTGTELSGVSLGMSLFGRLTLDALMSLDKITVDDASAPRRVGFSIGFEERF